jgi:signal transduction histidine kinase
MFDRVNPDMGGTGMQLALVKRIIEQHGVCIWGI